VICFSAEGQTLTDGEEKKKEPRVEIPTIMIETEDGLRLYHRLIIGKIAELASVAEPGPMNRPVFTIMCLLDIIVAENKISKKTATWGADNLEYLPGLAVQKKIPGLEAKAREALTYLRNREDQPKSAPPQFEEDESCSTQTVKTAGASAEQFDEQFKRDMAE
jgi:hypothetical protein